MEFSNNREAILSMEYNDETKFIMEKELLKSIQETKAKIRKLPLEVQKEIEAMLIAEIIYNSEALAGETLPKEEAIPLLIKNIKKGKHCGDLFRL